MPEPARGTEDACHAPRASCGISPSNRDARTDSLSRTPPGFNQSDAASRLHLPLGSLCDIGNVKGPASAASGKTQCLQISSQVLLLHLPWSTIVKEPLRIFKIKLPAAALSPRFAFFLLWMPPKPPVCCSFLFALETVRFILECRQASTPLLFGNAVFLTVRF